MDMFKKEPLDIGEDVIQDVVHDDIFSFSENVHLDENGVFQETECIKITISDNNDFRYEVSSDPLVNAESIQSFEKVLNSDYVQQVDDSNFGNSTVNLLANGNSNDCVRMCEICNLPIVAIDIASHYKTHFAEEPSKSYMCNVCKKGFTRKHDFQIHYRIHTGEKPHQCGKCSKSFTQLSSLQKHLVVHTGERPYVCHLCNRDFALKENYTKHYRQHTGDMKFTCDTCGKKFIHKSTLKKHQMIHTDEKPYMCTVCGRKFAFIENFNKHKFTHTGEKPHICNICGKGFSLAGNLRKHLLTHTGDKPFVCNVCNDSFSQQSSLERHQFRHLGAKPYSCYVCNVGFIQKNNLKRHLDSNRHKVIEAGLKMNDVTNSNLTQVLAHPEEV